MSGLISSGKIAVITIALEVPTGIRDHEIGPWAINQVSVAGGALPVIRDTRVHVQKVDLGPSNGQGRITPP